MIPITFNLDFQDLNTEKQFEILEKVKEQILENFKDEAKKKGITLKELMINPKYYDLMSDYDNLNEKDFETFYNLELDEFLEEQANEFIRDNFGYQLYI